MTPPRHWRISADTQPEPAVANDVAQILARVTACSLAQAQDFVRQLPAAMEVELYDYQASRLVQMMKERLPITISPL